MKKLLLIIIALLAATVGGFAQTDTKNLSNKTTPVNFERYDSYFVKNNANLQGDKSYLVVPDQKTFDKVFGYAATMDQKPSLAANAFKSKFVITAIKNGGSLRQYEDVQVTADKSKLIIAYTATDSAPGSATFTSPLVITVDKGRYKEVVFMENGKQAATVKIKK